jgi:hypothetical protein
VTVALVAGTGRPGSRLATVPAARERIRGHHIATMVRSALRAASRWAWVADAPVAPREDGPRSVVTDLHRGASVTAASRRNGEPTLGSLTDAALAALVRYPPLDPDRVPAPPGVPAAPLERVTPRIDSLALCCCGIDVVWDEVYGWLHTADDQRVPHRADHVPGPAATRRG